jgi:hypothetical protein
VHNQILCYAHIAEINTDFYCMGSFHAVAHST